MNATIQEIEGIDDYWGPAFRSVYEGEGHEAFVQQLDERIVQHDKEIEKLCNFHYQLKTRRKRRSNEHRDRNDYHKEITNNCSACYEEGCTLSKQHSTVTNGHDKHRKLLLAHNSANHHSVKTRDSIEGSKESPNSLPKRRCIDRNRLGGYSNIFPSQGTTHSDSLSSHNLSLDLNESFTIDNKRDSSDYISSDKYTETIKYHTLHQQKSPELFSNKPETPEDDLRLVLHNHNQHSDILTPQNLIISVKGLSNTSAQSFDNSEKISVDQQDLRSYLETKLCDKSVDCKHTNGLVRDSQWFSAKTLKKHSLEIDAFDLDRQRESVDLDSGRGQYLYEKNQTSPVSPHDYGRQRHTQLPGQNDTELIQNAASENDSDQGASISNQLYREKRHDLGREWKRDESRHLSLEHLSDQCLLSMSQQHGKYEANNHYRDHSRYDTVETSSSLSHNFHEQQEAIRKFERCKRPRKRQYDTMINYRSCSSSTSSDHDRYQTHHSRNTRRNRHSPVVFDKGQKQGSSVSVVYEHQQRKQSQNEGDSIRRREDYRPGSDQDNYQRPCSSSERNRRQEKARLDSRQNRLAFKGQDKYRNTTSSHKRDEHHTEDDNRQRNVEVSEPIRPSRSSSFDFSSQLSGSRPKPKPTLNRKQRNIQISKREFSRGQGRYDSEAYSHHLATQVRPSSSERNRNLLDSTKTSRTRSIEPLNYKIRQNRPKSIENEILQEPPIPSAAKRVYSRKHTSRGSSPCELRPKIAETCTKQPVIEKKNYVIESDQISAKPFNTVSSNTAVKLSSKSKPGNHSLSNIGAKPSNNAGIKATMVDNNSIGRRVTSSQIFQSESLQFRQPSADQNNTENVKTSDREDYLATEKETTDKIQNNVDISKEGIESIADGQNNSLFTSLNTSDQVDLTRESPKNVIAHDSDDCQDSIETVILDFDQGTLKERKSTLPSLDDKSELNIRNDDAGTQSNTVYDSNKITEYNNNDCKSNLQNIILTTQAMDCSTNSEMSKLEHHSEIPFSPSKQDDISGKSSNASKNISEIKQEPIEHLINTASSTVSSNHCVEKAFFGNPYKQTGVVQSEVLSEENIFMLSVRDFDSVNSLLSADSNSEKDESTFENNGVVEDIYRTIQVPAISDGFWYKPKKITFDNYSIQEKRYVANHRDPRLRLDISSSFKELNDQQEVFGDKSVKSYEYRCIYSDSIDNVDTKSHLDLLSESKGIIILPKAENESFKNAYSENLTISTDSSVESSCPKSPQFHENNNTQQEHFEERNAIPHFDPSNKQQNINDWINIVNKVAYACKWSDHQVVEYALPKLEGNTHTFFNDFSLNTSWKEYQKKLQTVYAPRANYAKLLCDMLSLKAMAGDSLIDYYVEKKKLLDKCSISGERAIDCVIFGVQDDSIRARLEAQAFFNLEDLSAYLHNL